MFAGAMAPDPAQGGSASVPPEAQASMGGQVNGSDDQDRVGERDQPDDSEGGWRSSTISRWYGSAD